MPLPQTTILSLLALLLLPIAFPNAEGQAYCSLRDPNHIVQEIFPTATGFRSYLRKITPEDTQTLREELAVEFDAREFTTHTLYAVHQNEKILGYIQSRTEEVEWGLAEIVWVLDPALRLNTFRFQRCRSRWKKTVESESLQRHLRGLSENELAEKVGFDGVKWLSDLAGTQPEATKLIEAVVNSGLKAAGLARIVWGEDIQKLRSDASDPKPGESSAER